ncbi:hypothetical protein [Nocardiopsis alborubida]|uniref:Uncharacterized protein n=1 Tax=Nocardiopsis alborubida TaxID=146802 RepID=A0A7X6MA20_9ACTN|nr:hypothetical protein [Nocardiopsis alborubida]NKY96769.1 hypothetical protein [Nocardiopsis alborubida]
MAPSRDVAEFAQRLHAAITALDPDTAPPLSEDPSPEEATTLMGLLLAHTDNMLHGLSPDRTPLAAAVYNQVLGNRREEGPNALVYERFAARLRFTGVALMSTTGRGPATMMSGCLLAAYEGAQAGAAAVEYYARPDFDKNQQLSLEDRERLNKHLVEAQNHLATARNGIAIMAGYPDGEPNPEDIGTTLESKDPRVTKIIDMGGSAYIEYEFATPDGPRRTAANLPLDGAVELVGLDTEERHAKVVSMVEASVDMVEAEGFQAPPG